MWTRMLLGASLACVVAGATRAEEAHLPKALPEPLCGAACEKHFTTYKLHWLERDGTPALKFTLKDITWQEPGTTYEIDWTEEQCVRTEMVLKPREITKEVTCCTMQPTTVKDPVTGCRTIEWKPVTETKLVKDTVFDLCPEEKVYTIKRPVLKCVDQIYNYKKLTLESELEKRVETFGLLVPCETTERVLVCPPPCSK